MRSTFQDPSKRSIVITSRFGKHFAFNVLLNYIFCSDNIFKCPDMTYVLDVMFIGLTDTVAFGPHYHSLLTMAIRVIVTVPMTFLGNCFLEVVHG